MPDATEVVDVLLAIMGEENRSALVFLDGVDSVTCADVARELKRRERPCVKPRRRRR